MHLWHKEMTLLLLLKCWLFSCWDTHVKNIYFFCQRSRRRVWRMKILIVFALKRVHIKSPRLCSAHKMFWSLSFYNIHTYRTGLMLVVEVYKLNQNGYNLQSLFFILLFFESINNFSFSQQGCQACTSAPFCYLISHGAESVYHYLCFRWASLHETGFLQVVTLKYAPPVTVAKSVLAVLMCWVSCLKAVTVSIRRESVTDC